MRKRRCGGDDEGVIDGCGDNDESWSCEQVEVRRDEQAREQDNNVMRNKGKRQERKS